MKQEFIGSSICTAVSATTTAIQPDAVFQYISIAITIISGLISIILGLRAWWKDAKKDGKIDKEEVKDAIEIVEDGLNGIKDKTQKGEKK